MKAHTSLLSEWYHIPLVEVGRLFCLYSLFVVYAHCYELFLAYQISTTFSYVRFDFLRLDDYHAVEILMPLAALPVGTRIRAASQYVAGAMIVFVFIPIPLVFIPAVSSPQFWSVFPYLWIAAFVVAALSTRSIAHNIRTLREEKFRPLLIVVASIFFVGLAYTALTNNLSFVDFSQIHDIRNNLQFGGGQGYIIYGFTAAFGGMFAAFAIRYKKLYILPVILTGFAVSYGVLVIKTAALTPFWIVYVAVAQRYFFRTSMIKYFVTLMMPFFLGSIFFIVSNADRESLLYAGFTIANYRLYTIPAEAFNVYYAFFETHPWTYWSHINIVSYFVSYPYEQPLSVLMEDAFQMGNYNASFVETDGLAAAGVQAIPLAALAFGMALVAVNSCLRGLSPFFVAIVMASPAIVFIDVGIGTGLLTNGVGMLALFLLFAPRESSDYSPAGVRRS
jgi:hypothetical protein